VSVYFVKPVGDDTRVKIGHTDNLEQRLNGVASEVAGGIELIAFVAGTVETEKAFHAICTDAWLEGEWYRLNHHTVQSLVQTFKDGVSGKRIWGRLRVVDVLPTSALDEDRNIARSQLKRLVDRFGQQPVGNALSMAFEILSSINPMWTRRRVRTIWESRAKRVDHYEFRDLVKANLLTSGEMEARRGASRPMGRMDLAGRD